MSEETNRKPNSSIACNEKHSNMNTESAQRNAFQAFPAQMNKYPSKKKRAQNGRKWPSVLLCLLRVIFHIDGGKGGKAKGSACLFFCHGCALDPVSVSAADQGREQNPALQEDNEDMVKV